MDMDLHVETTAHFSSEFAVQLQCCGISGYTDYNMDMWNTNPVTWHGRSADVLAPLTCCVQYDADTVYPPTSNSLSPSCIYNGTLPSDYYQPVGRPKYADYEHTYMSTVSFNKLYMA